jgi:hypothetical protein
VPAAALWCAAGQSYHQLFSQLTAVTALRA